MARHRLINCEFINASSFKVNVSNKAKLLYLLMLANADDRGFVDNTEDLINSLTNNDNEYNKSVSLELLANTYNSALGELLDKGYIYEFKDNHKNKVYLIRHWFYHNKLKKGLWTNYRTFLAQVYLEDNEYLMGKKPSKEDKVKEDNLNQDNILEEIDKEPVKEKPKELTIEEMFGKKSVLELTPEEKAKWEEYISTIDISDDDLPF